jgi:molybdopterin molybdotransferase
MPDRFAAGRHYPGAVSEFFTVRTIGDARAGYRPAHRSPVIRRSVDEARGLAAAAEVRSTSDLPGFRRSAVDGYAVRAADTRGAARARPARLALAGSVRMGELSAASVAAGQAFAIPTGGALPRGADAVVMVEHSALPGDGRVELRREAVPGDNVVGADDDVAAGASLIAAGRSVTAAVAGLLAAAGVTELDVHARPLVGLIATGDEVVDASVSPAGGEVRDANTPALSALVCELGGRPVSHGIVADDPQRLTETAAAALAACDVLVISAGSSVGARDSTARAVSAMGAPGIWCHGLAIRPGRPTMLADVGGKAVIGLPGNPVSALVAMRLIGADVIRRAGGHIQPAISAGIAATLDRNVPSAAGRLDVIQVSLRDDVATPLFAKASRLSVMAAADGCIEIAEHLDQLPGGSPVMVAPYR